MPPGPGDSRPADDAGRRARRRRPRHGAQAGPAREVAHSTAPEVGGARFHGAGDPALATEILGVLAKAKAKVTVLAVSMWLSAHGTWPGRSPAAAASSATTPGPTRADVAGPNMRVEIERCRRFCCSP